MYRPLKKLLEWPSAAINDFVCREVLHKADACAGVLAEARRLSLLGRYGAQLDRQVARALDLLDEIDELLVTIDPVSNGHQFAAAATLHRELDGIEAARTAVRRAQAPVPRTQDDR